MEKFAVWILGALMLLSSSVASFAHPVLVLDFNTGRVLYHKEAFARWYPASLTKLMTLYLTFQAMKDNKLSKESILKISPMAASMPPSNSGFAAGSTLSLDTALKILLIRSTNDLAISLAERVSGNVPRFVQLMNKTAQRLGMKSTHYTSPHGLMNLNNYTNARDLAVLAYRIRKEFPQFNSYFHFPALCINDNYQELFLNTNNLIERFKGIDGMKTGFLCASGYNLVASATREGRTLVAIVLGAKSLEEREIEAADLLEKGFRMKVRKSMPKLMQLPPYGPHQDAAQDLRKAVCHADQSAVKDLDLDNYGALIIHSPYVRPFTVPKDIIRLRVIEEKSPRMQ